MWIKVIRTGSYINGTFYERIASLLLAVTIARLTSRIIAPITAIIFKWIVIGNIRIAGLGIFAMHPSLEVLYYRLLGAHIGRNVRIEKGAKLGEYDLYTFRDGCRVDTALIRGFCVEREGQFSLGRIVIGEKAIINTFTQISPGAIIADNTVYGPHASSHDVSSPRAYAAFNRTLLQEPSFWLKLSMAWPAMALVYIISYVPWFVAIYLMFSVPKRVLYHALSRVVRAVVTLVLQLILGIIAKHMFGLNKESTTVEATQWSILRRYINSHLLSKGAMEAAFSILGTHYEVVSVAYHCMGAKIGKRVYLPGSGIYCLDPELLEIGNNVVFGSRSEVFTTDRIGTARVTVDDGAMISGRVVLLPGCKVRRRTVMGSGALGMRDTEYKDGSTWLGSECLDEGSAAKEDDPDTTTPFGRAFYKREADYFVFPYVLLYI
ncbi:hypothetical protein B0H11DRAFT_2434312 [Mycena galericulata]|nr:hypothetical protein B0H11DRAFT_2434312 [Mycena galericulata]